MITRAFATGLALALAPAAFADEVVLTDGAVLHGEARTSGEHVIVKLDIGTVTLAKSEVKEIRESKSPLVELEARRAKLHPEDVSGFRALAEWADAHGLTTQARLLWRRVVELSPNDARAHEQLGERFHEGKWLDEDEYMKARGFVRWFGEWLTAEEVKQRDAELEARRQQRALVPRAQPEEVTPQKRRLTESDDYQMEYYPPLDSWWMNYATHNPYYYYSPSRRSQPAPQRFLSASQIKGSSTRGSINLNTSYKPANP